MTNDNTMANDAGVGCSTGTYSTINGSDLVMYGRTVADYRAPVKRNVSSIEVDVSDTDITRSIKRI